MASPTRRASNALKLERSCEVSRLGEQLLAGAYELATPLLRHPIPHTAPGQRPTSGHATDEDRPRHQAGGSQA
jgi:hypothetical protein